MDIEKSTILEIISDNGGSLQNGISAVLLKTKVKHLPIITECSKIPRMNNLAFHSNLDYYFGKLCKSVQEHLLI